MVFRRYRAVRSQMGFVLVPGPALGLIRIGI